MTGQPGQIPYAVYPILLLLFLSPFFFFSEKKRRINNGLPVCPDLCCFFPFHSPFFFQGQSHSSRCPSLFFLFFSPPIKKKYQYIVIRRLASIFFLPFLFLFVGEGGVTPRGSFLPSPPSFSLLLSPLSFLFRKMMGLVFSSPPPFSLFPFLQEK